MALESEMRSFLKNALVLHIFARLLYLYMFFGVEHLYVLV